MSDSLIKDISLRELVTIVIPCKNEENYIHNLLYDLKNQKGINGVCILVADANSVDATREIVEAYQQKLNIKLIEGGTVSVGRNNGALISVTPYVLFIDADVRFFSSTVIYDSVQRIHTEQLDLIGLSPTNYGRDWRASLLFYLFGKFNKIFSKFTPFAIGAFFLTRRSKFNELGGFPNRCETSEDYILSKQYDPRKFAIVNHYFGQDERRFKKLGYLGMVKYMVMNFFNRHNLKHFEKSNVNYWR